MDLSVTWLGSKLAHPLIPGASPLADDLDAVRRLQDAGAPALVLRSLFEEQIAREQLGAAVHAWGLPEQSEAGTWLPEAASFSFGPDEYLEHLRRVREATGLPVIASINGSTRGGWIRYARWMQEAGANALELNIFDVPANPREDGATVERRLLEVVREVRATVSLPLAVKLSAGFTSPAHVVSQLQDAGADGVVLFNRGHEPVLDIEELEVGHAPSLSTSADLPLRLRWLAIIRPGVRIPLACSGGVHEPADALRALMAGATAVQLVSCLLQHGPRHLAGLVVAMQAWLDERGYTSMEQVIGSLDRARCPNPAQYERANYMSQLQAWHVTDEWGR